MDWFSSIARAERALLRQAFPTRNLRLFDRLFDRRSSIARTESVCERSFQLLVRPYKYASLRFGRVKKAHDHKNMSRNFREVVNVLDVEDSG